MTATGSLEHDFKTMLERYRLRLKPLSLNTLQLNITRQCNQHCYHCHIQAAPERKEQMGLTVIDRCLEVLARHSEILCVDITGGAPELNPYFDYLVAEATKLKKRVLVRHNLTVTLDGNPVTGERKDYLPEFFAGQGVEVVASLPDCSESETDRQRGKGVFHKSIEGIRRLNIHGYGRGALKMHLVCNPPGALLPEAQSTIEDEFRTQLQAKYGIEFNRLYALTNMPVGRFRAYLERSGGYRAYMAQLVAAFNPKAAARVQCRNLVSIGYDGKIYDCDFNQALGLPVAVWAPMTAFNLDMEALRNREIDFGPHCFGCAAGSGSG